jgi:alpha-methylacyl-CoA racemase
MARGGPLAGIRVVELAGIGPAPFAAMLLADLGAEVLRIDRREGADWPDIPVLERGRARIALDLKSEDGLAAALDLIAAADVLIEGFRPGVMEKIGLGPAIVHARAPRLVYGRMTGWGQTGPLADRAGHDINYIALAGSLAAIARPGAPPSTPLNLLGDYAAGALYLVFGITSALVERERSGLGQVVDAAIVDGAASLMAPIIGMARAGIVSLDPTANVLNGSIAPFYRCYRCRDGRDVAVGPLEPRFRAQLAQILGLGEEALGGLDRPDAWPRISEELAAIFLTRDRDEWGELFSGSDACVSPVMALDEAPSHPHLAARGTYVVIDGVTQPAAAPRFSRTPAQAGGSAQTPEAHALAKTWGVELPDH